MTMVGTTLQQKSLWKTTLSKDITLAMHSKLFEDYSHLSIYFFLVKSLTTSTSFSANSAGDTSPRFGSHSS